MLDLALRCGACDYRPATLTLNGRHVCRACALVAVDRASPPPTARRSVAIDVTPHPALAAFLQTSLIA
jgi:hypothetical protein